MKMKNNVQNKKLLTNHIHSIKSLIYMAKKKCVTLGNKTKNILCNINNNTTWDDSTSTCPYKYNNSRAKQEIKIKLRHKIKED